ncbi:MAG: glycosyltransferase family 2 protein [Leptolyngbyaceae cyanobacterium SU_3_3]|nr:glycosyltransferase family 2 protein [Leptolyngbyaceae cyanobacterium SU_3_3]
MQSAILRNRPTPSVAVITYVYNGARYIEELIQSVLAQTHQDFEFLILDDGSAEHEGASSSRYLHDQRIHYVHQENIGRNLDAFHELINRSVALTSARTSVLPGLMMCFSRIS